MILKSNCQTISSECIQKAIRPMGVSETIESPSKDHYSLAQINPNATGQRASKRRNDLAWQIDYLTSLHARVPERPRVLNALILSWQAKAAFALSQGDTRAIGHCAKYLARLNQKSMSKRAA